MRTRHHRLPRNMGGGNNRANLVWIDHRKHNAWNILTNNSTMSFEAIAEELSQYIPRHLKFVLVNRGD